MELFTEQEFNQARNKNKLKIQCDHCGNILLQSYARIKQHRKSGYAYHACNRSCSAHLRNKQNGVGSKILPCKNCGKIIVRQTREIKKSKNLFCGLSCSALYSKNHFHKRSGTQRSKLEMWIEQQLTKIYSTLDIHYNRNDTINSELDIYIPKLKLAFELNGPFHYEPIFGQEKLSSIQNNDQRKFQACLEKDIEFCTIDVSAQKYVTPKTSQKYLDIVVKIINQKIERLH